MTDHQHPPLPPLFLPGCIASQALGSHHYHFLHHDCHGHHHHHRHHHHHHHLHQQHCHYHHHYHHPFCRQHSSVYHQADHFNLTPYAASSLHLPAVSLPEQPQVAYSVSTQNHQNQAASACKDVENSGVQLHEEWTEEVEEEEEPVFVMTDEWMEFFAKSEAKRKLEKQAKKKKAKN